MQHNILTTTESESTITTITTTTNRNRNNQKQQKYIHNRNYNKTMTKVGFQLTEYRIGLPCAVSSTQAATMGSTSRCDAGFILMLCP